jgi:hypothetical protein
VTSWIPGAYGFCHCCCPGSHSWIHLTKAFVKRFLLWEPLRTFDSIDFLVVHPDDLIDYIEGKTTKLVGIKDSKKPKQEAEPSDLSNVPGWEVDAEGDPIECPKTVPPIHDTSLGAPVPVAKAKKAPVQQKME